MSNVKLSEAFKIHCAVVDKRRKEKEDRARALREAYYSDPDNKRLRPEEEPDEWYGEIPEMTEEQWTAYHEKIAASDGFDVDDFSHTFACGRIEPITLNIFNIKEYSDYAEFAINKYNEEKNSKFKFTEIKKVNERTFRYEEYFITFIANDSDETKVFQALVVKNYDIETGEPNLEVEVCRLKPTNSEKGENQNEEKMKLIASENDVAILDMFEKLPMVLEELWSNDPNSQLEATKQFVTFLLIELYPKIYEGFTAVCTIARFVEFLGRDEQPQLQFEAASALTNFASGRSEQTQDIIEYGAVPRLVRLLDSGSEDVREQAARALGNVAGDSPSCRDIVLGNGALMPLLALLNVAHSKLSTLRIATWTLSNFCCGRSSAPLEQVKLVLPILRQLIDLDDEEVLTNACWTLSYLSDGPKDQVEAVIEAGVCQRLLELLLHPSHTVLIPALRTFGNIVMHDDSQNQAIIESDIIHPLVHLLQHAELDIKMEAAWAISNACSGGSHEQIRFLVGQGCIKPFCDLLVCPDPRIVKVCLEWLENILKVGEADKEMGMNGGVNLHAQMIAECDGLDKIKNLQARENNEIYKEAVKDFGEILV